MRSAELEALASALQLGATVCGGERNQPLPLLAAAQAAGVDVVAVPLHPVADRTEG